jgi:hypothetical protein
MRSGAQVLNRSGDRAWDHLVFKAPLIPATKNRGSSIRSRFQSFPGSAPSRHNHSAPRSRSHAGARATVPAKKRKTPPTPTTTGTRSFPRFSAIHRSCFGQPGATHKMSGQASWTRAISFSRSVSVLSENGWENAPAISAPESPGRSVGIMPVGSPPYPCRNTERGSPFPETRSPRHTFGDRSRLRSPGRRKSPSIFHSFCTCLFFVGESVRKIRMELHSIVSKT